MPKRKKAYIDIPKFLTSQALDIAMFCYILGVQRGMPSITLKRAMELFMEDCNLTEDDYPLDLGLRMWYRMHKRYVEFRKT